MALNVFVAAESWLAPFQQSDASDRTTNLVGTNADLCTTHYIVWSWASSVLLAAAGADPGEVNRGHAHTPQNPEKQDRVGSFFTQKR